MLQVHSGGEYRQRGGGTPDLAALTVPAHDQPGVIYGLREHDIRCACPRLQTNVRGRYCVFDLYLFVSDVCRIFTGSRIRTLRTGALYDARALPRLYVLIGICQPDVVVIPALRGFAQITLPLHSHQSPKHRKRWSRLARTVGQ